MSQILRVTQAFSVLSDPDGHIYTPGELVDANHPHVKGREDHFETVEAHVSARVGGGVEEATAQPGGKRSRTKPRRESAKPDPGAANRREPEPELPHPPVVVDGPEKSPNPKPSKSDSD